ncbi:MAG: GxxExxY protein [Flavobacteriales bacterium]|nr:GxxExxY protein [Flavobacteriales bacterium]MCB0785038.1 GxxExxY protein [Flavobacteriales bacterium]MCB0810831.1 GxxExxY protein [Flavobacteriales bacterium]
MKVNEISGVVLDEAIRLHREIGPGVLESVYEAVLAKRLDRRGLVVERQKIVPLTIDGEDFGEVFRVDLLVNKLVVVELKSVEELHPVHFKQVLTYLRLLGLPLGLLINFGGPILKQGFHRIANNLTE